MGQLRQRGSVWWVRYYRNGKRYEESSGSERKGDAIDLLKLREGDIARGVPVSPKIARLTFTEAAADVVTDHTVNGRKSLKNVEGKIKNHLTPFFGARRMAQITTSDIRTFIAQRQTAGASAGEINRELTILKRSFNLSIQAGKLLHKPHIPMLREDNVRRGFFEDAEFEAVRGALPPVIQGIVTFAFLTGWRIASEILPLTWAQIDRERSIVRLEPGKTKNGRGRVLPYGDLPALVDVIEARWREREALQKAGRIVPAVFHRNGRPVKNFAETWRKACEAAGVPGRIPHDFRRTAARNLLRAGVPEKTAMMITGHETRSVFDRYCITSDADVQQALGKLAGTKQGQSANSPRVRKFRKSS